MLPHLDSAKLSVFAFHNAIQSIVIRNNLMHLHFSYSTDHTATQSTVFTNPMQL